MALQLIETERVREIAKSNSLNETERLYELIRAELWARGVTTRRLLCERVVSLTWPQTTLNKEMVQNAIEEMARSGDVTVGSMGGVAAAPLRIVHNGAGRFRLFGTLPTRLMNNLLLTGNARELLDNTGEIAQELFSQYGGVLLTAEQWAGFDRVLAANEEWLDQLAGRIEIESSPPGRFDEEVNHSWMGFRLSTSTGTKKNLWKKPAANNDEVHLWRGWSIYGWPIYLWTAGGSPSECPSLRLTSDEGNRTIFALARRAGYKMTLKAETMMAEIILRIELFLPSAEYRFLLAVGMVQGAVEGAKIFRIPLEVWPQVEKLLRERLGVTFETTG